jgi:uncharacterized protein YprB with RNaseH-like and TPR domain
MTTLKKHFVTFYSPGTFVSEETTKPIDSWDIEAASKMAHTITERYGATPYAFQFSTRGHGDDDLDSKTIATSGRYYLGGKIETLRQVKARNDPKERILLSNMECNGWKKIIVNDNSWRFSAPLMKGDTVLDWKPKAKHAARDGAVASNASA